MPSPRNRLVSKKRKIRVDFKKNRQKRTRAGDLTNRFHSQGAGGLDSASGERVRAKGDLSRKRTIVSDLSESAADDSRGDTSALLSIDLSECVPGRVVRVHGLESIVETDDGRSLRCGVRRILKTIAIDGRGIVAVGDRVWIKPAGPGSDQGQIENVETRKGVVTRGYRRREHIIVSNVDQLLIVCSFVEPDLKPSLIDRYLISAERGNVRPIIVINKADLVEVSSYQWVIGLYSQLGYETITTSTADGRGVDRVKGVLSRGVTALSGQSGVGKSSLLNAIEPGLKLKVREVSGWTSKGKHTTTFAELIKLESGGRVVDTPGLRQFELWGVEPGELEGFFVEFRPFIPLCRFPDCSHTHETACAVKDAVSLGLIHIGRYESYLKLHFRRPEEGD